MTLQGVKKTARATASQLLASANISRAPINVQAIAEDILGIRIEDKMELPDELSGLIKRKGQDGRPVIAVNNKHTKTRQRFTIAHEIGHYLLHALDPVHIDKDKVYFRDGKSSLAIDLKEIQANQFAAELLMPTDLLVKDLKDGIPLDEIKWSKKINDLAEKYEVSNEAMTIRVGVLLQGGLN